MLGALAVSTERVTLGPLVARIGVVPDAVLISQMRTACRLADGRFIAGIGVGDKESDPEDAALGVTRPSLDERFVRLEFVASALHDDGIEVWVGGRSRRAATLSAALGVGRNLWDPTDQQMADAILESEGHPITWGATLDITSDDGVDALAQRFAALNDMGVAAAVVAPTKAGAPDAAARVMRAKKSAGLP
jgi:alkanesulfonate monooxygenase SsuD/methylene tetrahydromethanopterin reductase-like flavin-dependent oxidoreductase (luciferase family)